MPAELRLSFPDAAHVSVALLGSSQDCSPLAPFDNPLSEKDMAELRWYVEDYGTGYRAEPDDQRAAAVRDKLPVWGAELFAAVFKTNDEAATLFDHFLKAKKEGRVLSIAADHPAVLSLPWELLTAPGRSFLFNEQPPISIRRGLPAAKQECAPQPRTAKPLLHLLFIISRPDGAGFLNPRSDAQAVLNALEQQDAVRVEVEFLRLATLAKLKQRLSDSTKAPIDIIHFDGHGVLAGDDSAGKEGFLLFEGEWGGTKKVSGKELGRLLNSSHTGLAVLSACRSAMMDSEDPMSGVAAQLVHAGIPAVIAMTYSALVTTTELLFAAFYRSLFKGRTVASSLDEARYALCAKPERGTRLRGAHNAQEVTLELHDWFLPALYQSGADMALLSAADADSLPPKAEPLHNLPDVQKSGFFGRTWELWQIERFFAVNHCRRISITGFGGQGKTALACEAGRWLLRTKLFQRACLVRFDSYQGSDPVSMAVSTMSAVFQESLLDAAAAEASLERTPSLLILDNLETLAESGALAELLDAAAKWSEAGDSHVLLTSRQPDFQHPAYPVASKQEHRHIALQSLREDDAVEWFDEMYRLPPEAKQPRPQRDVLVRLFEQVGFHPLSISLLAQQLKEHGPAELGERLEELLGLQPLSRKEHSLLASLELYLEWLPKRHKKWLLKLVENICLRTLQLKERESVNAGEHLEALLEEQQINQDDRSLLASLELSIERLPEQCRKWLPWLGVFQGGCLEEMVGRVTRLKEADWQELRSHLLRAGLMQDERVPNTGNIFLRFHPTLAPALWQKLGKGEQARLMESYWHAYYQLSQELYKVDRMNPHTARALAHCEVPNLLRAVHAGLQEDGAEEGQEFAGCVNEFFLSFGMQRDSQALTEVAAKAGGLVGSQAWYLAQSNLGEQLLRNGQSGAAAQVFADILAGLREAPSGNRCVTLGRLGRCCFEQSQLAQAERLYHQELAELAQLERSDKVRKSIGTAQTNLADVLTAQGRYTEAKAAYQAALKIAEEQGDKRQMGVVLGQFGTLLKEQGELDEAEKRYKKAIGIFQSIIGPATEAVFWHQLGLVYQDAKHWEAAEQAYRQAARLREEQGLMGGINGAGVSWQQLAQLCAATSRVAEAEQWYRKALAARRAAGDQSGIARTLNNLAVLLANDPARLDEARALAEESLAIKDILDHAAMTMWTTYHILADIAAKQGESSQAAVYRDKSRHAYFAFPGWRQQLYQHEELIAAVVQVNTDPALRKELEQSMDESNDAWANIIGAIRRIFNGERDEAALYEPLGYQEAGIIRAILEGIEGQR